ncbi:MAG: phosphate ABC transporter substrate-binding/OmpA family protein [Candidatus Sulfotelmatobacter sp.]|jgi:phosphate transport system substrate-binding protein
MPARKILTPITAAIVAVVLLCLAGIFWFELGRPGARSRISPDDIILRLSGSNTIGESLAPALAEEFFKQQGATDIKTIPGDRDDEVLVSGILPSDRAPKVIQIHAHGSALAFEDLGNGRADIGMASRRIKTEEAAQLASLGDMTSPACEHILGLDGITVIVSRKNPVRTLSKDQIAQIFTGTIGNWLQVGGTDGPIHLYVRDDKSGTYDTFRTLVLGDSPLAPSAKRVEDSRKLSDFVSQDPNGIGFIGLAYVQDARALAVYENGATALLPTPFTVATEDYALSRRLFLYTPAQPRKELIRRFVDFAISGMGQNIVAEIGFVGQNVSAAASAGSTAVPADYRRLTSGFDRLSLDFRFREGSSELDNKAVADLTRVVTFVTDLHYNGDNLVLLGFDDSKEVTDNLSKARADAVAQQFEQRGVKAATVMGFGSQIAVASNDTPEGRQKNRRVEIWLKR